jgi:hypothetical protein
LNVPLLLKVKLKDAPLLIVPESKSPAEVTVWGIGSSFVQVTAVPCGMFIVFGANCKFLMEIVPAAGGAFVAAGATFAGFISRFAF